MNQVIIQVIFLLLAIIVMNILKALLRREFGGHLEHDRVVYFSSSGIKESCSIEFDRATMIRDSCIDALGEIRKNFPKSVQFAIPFLESLSKNAPSPYTVKKAMWATEAIKELP